MDDLVTPARQGELNPETKFILDKFGFEAPLLKTSLLVMNYLSQIIQISPQAPQELDKTTVVGIVDHHKLEILQLQLH